MTSPEQVDLGPPIWDQGDQTSGTASRQATSGPAAQLDSEEIREVQQALGQKGYDAGPVDGIWGPRTTQAMRNFQQTQNLTASGEPDQESLNALGLGSVGRAIQPSGTQQATEGPAAQLDPSKIRQVQKVLDEKGYDAGPVDGIWGPRSTQAMRNFQQTQNLAASGQPDQESLNALGLSSIGQTIQPSGT